MERLVTAFLRDHPTYGVNPLLAGVALLGDDLRPDPIPAFYCSTDDECVASKLEPDTTPCIVVLSDSHPVGTVHRKRGQHDTTLTMQVAYFASSEGVAQIRQDWLYVGHAIITALLAFGEPSVADVAPGWRQLGPVKFLRTQSVTEVPMSGSRGSLQLVGLVSAEMQAAYYVTI